MQELLHDGDLPLNVLEEGLVGPARLLLLQEVLREYLDGEELVSSAVLAQTHLAIDRYIPYIDIKLYITISD